MNLPADGSSVQAPAPKFKVGDLVRWRDDRRQFTITGVRYDLETPQSSITGVPESELELLPPQWEVARLIGEEMIGLRKEGFGYAEVWLKSEALAQAMCDWLNAHPEVEP